jgi:hypothetical protein
LFEINKIYIPAITEPFNKPTVQDTIKSFIGIPESNRAKLIALKIALLELPSF